MNGWNIPSSLELEVRRRDTRCIYCGVKFNSSIKKQSATWEHIINDAKIINRNNIALCCCSCNASKGARRLEDWLNSDYCRMKKITKSNIALVARRAIKNPPIVEV